MRSGPYKTIGAGYALTIPVSVIIVAVLVAVAAVLIRRTALGMLIESVGGSPTASRLAGIQSRRFIWMVYVFAAVCAASRADLQFQRVQRGRQQRRQPD